MATSEEVEEVEGWRLWHIGLAWLRRFRICLPGLETTLRSQAEAKAIAGGRTVAHVMQPVGNYPNSLVSAEPYL